MCNKRLWFIFVILFLITGLISFRLFVLQIVEGDEWKAKAQGQQKYFEETKGDRGNIYLSSESGGPVLVATNKIVYNAYIAPREIEKEEREDIASFLSDTLEIEKDFVLEKMEKNNSYEVLKKNLTKEEAEKIKEKEKVHIKTIITRSYPEEQLAAHILGFVGGEGIGQYGVEQYYEEKISGRVGIKEGMRDSHGSFFITKDSVQKGEDLYLTIDYNIQHFSEKALEGAITRVNAVRGLILVGDPQTGEILAMAEYPAFDPNKYNETNPEIFKNLAVQETFEPGSVFKPITMAIALDQGVVSPDDTFYDEGQRTISGKTIRNYDQRSYGLVTMSQILEKSINMGIVFVKDKIGNKIFENYLTAFKFFEKTGVDLHGEVVSLNKEFFQRREINYATASYGQGIEITPMQLFRSFCVIANGGRMVTPHILKNETEDVFLKEKIISSTATSLVTEMMVNTVEMGYGRTARVPGYYIAGKTGTAQVSLAKLGLPGNSYYEKTIQSFIGFAPALNPQFIIFVRLDLPDTKSAEVSAGPVFKEVAEYILEYKKIPYDYEVLK
jgi:cell division protein FtsI/penicillin-binding protein 2